jgi:hypothetical protein
MKHIFFTMLFVSAVTILGLSSCKKENLSSESANNHPDFNISPQVPTTMNLVASNWATDANGFYVSTFHGIISPANTNNSHAIKIYLADSGKDIQINQYIYFMGGELFGTSSETDVKINYRCNAQNLPFNALNIRVVIE